MDPAYETGLRDLIALYFHEELSAVDEGYAITKACCLRRRRLTKNGKRIVMVAARPAHASHRLDPVAHGAPLRISLHRVPPVKSDPVGIAELPVKVHTGGLLEQDLCSAGVHDLHRAGDHIKALQNAVLQFHRHSCIRVLHTNEQALCFRFRSINCRQPFQRIFPRLRPISVDTKRTGFCTAYMLRTQRAHAVIPGAETAVFLRQEIR